MILSSCHKFHLAVYFSYEQVFGLRVGSCSYVWVHGRCRASFLMVERYQIKFSLWLTRLVMLDMVVSDKQVE